MIEKDFIQDTGNAIILTDPVFGIRLKENLVKNLPFKQ